MSSFIAQTLAGKSIGRILFNREVARATKMLSGRVIDLGGGAHPSYRTLIPKQVELITTEVNQSVDADMIVDLNMSLPFTNGSVENFLCFNVIYILEDQSSFLRDAHRALTDGGRLFLSSPFITNEMPEPHDYLRYTKEGLMRALTSAGFTKVEIRAYGERATSAVYLLDPILHFGIIRLPFYALALLVDKLLPLRLTSAHPAPIGYFVVATK